MAISDTPENQSASDRSSVSSAVPPAPVARRWHPGYLFFTGVCMGAADVVPGVSGGTMAFILGIYEDLLCAIKSVDLRLVRHLWQGQWRAALTRIPWAFVVPLLTGLVTAVLTLAKILDFLLVHHEGLTFAFFFGLVLASIVALAARLRWSLPRGGMLLAGAVFAYWLVGLVPAETGHSPLVLLGSGMLAICAMILPGISGSFILLILGQLRYIFASLSQIITALRGLDLTVALSELFQTVLPVAVGAVLGLMMFSRVLSWLLARYHALTVAALTGFMIGSLRRLWPFKEYVQWTTDRHGEPIPTVWQNVLPSAVDADVIAAGVLCLAGFVVISLLDHLYDRRNPIVCWMTRRRAAV